MRIGRFANLLFIPSLFSVSFSLVVSILTLGIANWSYITPKGSIYDYIFGPYGLTTELQHATNSLSAINGVFSSPVAYNIAILILALFIGMLVFVLLEGLDHVAQKATEAINEVEYIDDVAAKEAMKKEAELRIGLRVATLIVWAGYFIFFARVIIPYCIILGRIDTTHLWTLYNIWNGLAAGTLLMLSLHIHAIFMRLLVLRPRLFGGTDVIIGQSGHSSQ